MQAVTIRGSTLPLPILQGGMGVGVSLDRLAGAVAACGGMGTISTAVAGFREPDFDRDPNGAYLRALEKAIRRAKEMARWAGYGGHQCNGGHRPVRRQHPHRPAGGGRRHRLRRRPSRGSARLLPRRSADVALAPIVCSGRAAATLCKLWYKHFGVVPDFVVLEGPLAGGHLGFSREEAGRAKTAPLSAWRHFCGRLGALRPFRELAGRDIPVFAAGGVYTAQKRARLRTLGAAGVQLATRFIGT